MKAFPMQGLTNGAGGMQYEAVFEKGMDLRDYFAAKALQGILSNPDLHKIVSSTAKDLKINIEDAVSNIAYSQADSMIKARAK